MIEFRRPCFGQPRQASTDYLKKLARIVQYRQDKNNLC